MVEGGGVILAAGLLALLAAVVEVLVGHLLGVLVSRTLGAGRALKVGAHRDDLLAAAGCLLEIFGSLIFGCFSF